MKAKLVRSVKKLAAVATGALFLGATLGMASAFGVTGGLNTLPSPFVSNGQVNAVVVVGANSAPTDILGAIDIAAALAAAARSSSGSSGIVTIGSLALASSALSHHASAANGTAFPAFTPGSVSLSKVNWSGVGKQNYTSVENVTFSGSTLPYFNGLNVVFPAQSFWLSSYVVNRSNGKALLALTSQLSYEIGTSKYTLLAAHTNNLSFGVLDSFTNQLIPSSITVGTNTVNLLGIATITGATLGSSYNQLEFTVNNGATDYVNFSSTITVLSNGVPVTVTTGKTVLTNKSGSYLSSLSVSSTGLIQNNSHLNVFGLGAFNASFVSTGKFVNFSNNNRYKLNYTFGATGGSFSLPAGLSTMTLEPLTHIYNPAYGGAQNVSVTVGTAGKDRYIPAIGDNSSTSVSLNYTTGLPNVEFGTDYRGPLTSSGVGGPDLLLEGNQSLFNISSGQTVKVVSEILYPNPLHAQVFANATSGKDNATFPSTTSKGAAIRLVYELPNGRDIAVQFSPVRAITGGLGDNLWNATAILNYTASTVSNPQIINVVPGMVYAFNGYNLSTDLMKPVPAGLGVIAFNLTGPVATVGSYNIVPGYSGLYASNGTALSKATLSNGGGTLSFGGTTITYTDPLGATQAVSVAENKTNFATYVTTPTNTSAVSGGWGDFVTGATKNGATFDIPVQNYSLALGGSLAITGRTNYTVGQTIPAGGELLGVNGASSGSASGLFASNLFPLAQEDSGFSGATNAFPVIVVGGPGVNTLAKTLLNITNYQGGAQFTNLTGVSSGEAVIQYFSSVSGFNGHPALWVAGYGSQDSLEAAEVLAESLIGTPVVSLTGNKVILSTSAASYSGVTVVSSS